MNPTERSNITDAELIRLKSVNAELVAALKKAAMHLRTALRGIDNDHPMYRYFTEAEAEAREAIARAKE